MKKTLSLLLNKKHLLVLMVAILLSLPLFYLSSTSEKSYLQQTGIVDYGDIESYILATGVLKPSEQVSVGAQVNGQLHKLHVKEGEKVTRGQLLAEIDPTLQQSEVNRARAELENALIQREIAQLNVDQALRELNRQNQMAKDGAAIPSEQENAQLQYDINQAQLKANSIQIDQARLSVETAEANLAYTKITAPIDGEVLGILTQEGQTIVSSQSAPTIMILANLDNMSIHTRISEADILKVRQGQPLWFYIIAAPEHRYDSQLGTIQQAPDDLLKETGNGNSSALNTSAVYYNGVFNIANPDRQLKPAMTAQIFIITAQVKQVLRMPLQAVLRPGSENGQYWVQVKDASQVTERLVTTGISNHEYVEIISGLNAGETIMLGENAHALR